jgi:hypothetical protein
VGEAFGLDHRGWKAAPAKNLISARTNFFE